MKYYFYGWLIMVVGVGALGLTDVMLYKKMNFVSIQAAALDTDAASYRERAEVSVGEYKTLWAKNENAAAFLRVWRSHLARGPQVSDTVAALSQLAQDVAKDEKQALSFEINQIIRVMDYPLLVESIDTKVSTASRVPGTQATAQPPSAFGSGKPIAANSYSCVVRGPYHLVMNWLGRAEELFPVAKVDQAKMSVQSNAISLSLVLMFPEIEVNELVAPLDLSAQ